MCGFAGVVDPPSPGIGRGWAAWAASHMVRRGPDDDGHWSDDDAGVHLSFRRLAIIDLSAHGHQPMVSADGSSVLVFNGELYGHSELRRQLQGRGVEFRGTSDTEVVLASLQTWGDAALDRFDGMFAFAWWHRESRHLVLARDHAGIKPLFYATGPGGHGVCFASQYDVVANGPWGVPPVDPAMLSLYLELHHVPAPFGLLERTGQLEPGEMVVVADGRIASRRRWWTLPAATQSEAGSAAVDHVSAVLDAAVGRQLVADRPVGTFLSGGVDSALVTSLAVDDVTEPLQSFTVSFPGAASDEAAKATEFASALGVEHHVLELDDTGADAAVQAAVDAGAEPVGDFSIVPTTLLSGFAAERVTVALSGDGGDELFYGYVRPWSLLRSGAWFRAPRTVRRARYYAGRLAPRVVPAVSEAITAVSPGDYYRSVNSRSAQLRDRLGPDLPFPPALWWFDTPDRLDRQGLIELTRTAEYYGQLQRVLRKVDMASMHHSLEVRVPVLSRSMVELSASMDAEFCLRDGARKAPLRDLLARKVPGVSQQSVKQGFTPPLNQWIDGPLQARIGDQMADRSWQLDAWLDPAVLRTLARPDTPARHWNLWTVLSLEWWLTRLRGLPRDFDLPNAFDEEDV